MMSHDGYDALFSSEIRGVLQRDVPLSELGRWRIGGPVDVLASPRNVSDLQILIRLLSKLKRPYHVIGDGSNILFDDAGFRGVLVYVGSAFSQFEALPAGDVTAGAGLWVPDFVRRVGLSGLAGCAHAIGIPGRLGGLIVMNGGSQRKGIGDQLVHVTVVDSEGNLRVIDRDACGFSYRSSALQEMRAIVVEARFRYSPADPAQLRREMLEILRERRGKFPKELPNCGSVFLSDAELYSAIGPPGQAIEEAGLKGERVGGAQFSPAHANFITNVGNASSYDVLSLIRRARDTVHKRTGFQMDCEVRHLTPDGFLRQAHISAEEFIDPS